MKVVIFHHESVLPLQAEKLGFNQVDEPFFIGRLIAEHDKRSFVSTVAIEAVGDGSYLYSRIADGWRSVLKEAVNLGARAPSLRVRALLSK